MSRGTARRLTALALMASCAVILSGCVTMKSHNTYHVDGTLDASVLIAVDQSLAEDGSIPGGTGEDFLSSIEQAPEFEQLREELGDHLTVEPYEQDGQVGLTMTMIDVTPHQLSQANAAGGTPSGTSTISVDGDRMTLTFEPDAALDSEFESGWGSLADIGLEPAVLDSVFDFEARHTFPGPVVSTTIGHIDPDDPNTVVIDSFVDLTESTSYTIVAKTSGPGGVSPPWQWMGIGAVVLVGISIGLLAWWRARRTASATPGEAGATEDAEGEPPPPPPPPPAPRSS